MLIGGFGVLVRIRCFGELLETRDSDRKEVIQRVAVASSGLPLVYASPGRVEVRKKGFLSLNLLRV
jgi:hypothetical protein